jgi:hypothetical protein
METNFPWIFAFMMTLRKVFEIHFNMLHWEHFLGTPRLKIASGTKSARLGM